MKTVDKNKESKILLGYLEGEHELSGVCYDRVRYKPYGELDYFLEDAEAISFVLDGTTYTAVQDPDDGYRSSLGVLFRDEIIVNNKFKPIKVSIKLIEDEQTGACFIQAKGVENGKVVLEVGTKIYENDYPLFVGKFYPENIDEFKE